MKLHDPLRDKFLVNSVEGQTLLSVDFYINFLDNWNWYACISKSVFFFSRLKIAKYISDIKVHNQSGRFWNSTYSQGWFWFGSDYHWHTLLSQPRNMPEETVSFFSLSRKEGMFFPLCISIKQVIPSFLSGYDYVAKSWLWLQNWC